jgi:hypothetical protein
VERGHSAGLYGRTHKDVDRLGQAFIRSLQKSSPEQVQRYRCHK